MGFISCANIPGMRTGNAMFWLATSLAYSLRHNLELHVPFEESTVIKELYNLINKSGYTLLPTKRGLNEKILYCNYVAGISEIPDNIVNGSLKGYFQNAALFNDYEKEVRDMFGCLTSKESKPGQLNIHIRLGDYKDYESIYYTIDPAWLKRALALCGKFDYIKLFSDEPDKAAEILKEAYSGEFVVDDSRTAPEGIKSMTEGDQFIISASSLSWWGAWLGKHKNVIYPSPWIKKEWAAAHNTPLPTWVGLPYNS